MTEPEENVEACIVCDAPMAPTGPWTRRCAACGFERSSLEPSGGAAVEGVEALRRANFRTMLDAFERLAPIDGVDVLEVGCAGGLFLDEAARRGARALGLEPDPTNAASARERGHDVVTGFFPGALDGARTFDVVVFNDVFEHLPDPVGALQAVDAALRPGGALILNLPSTDGVFYRVARAAKSLGVTGPYERLWQAGLPSPHLSYFSDDTLRRFVERRSSLVLAEAFTLPSIVREGLRERIATTHSGPVGAALYAALWLATPAMGALPADIIVHVYRKPSDAADRAAA